MAHLLSVVLQTPAHSGLAAPLTYASEVALAPGTLVRVPLGSREVLGIVWDVQDGSSPAPAPPGLRAIQAELQGLAPLSASWRQLVQFAAHYYQRAIGEVALAALPPALRDLDDKQLARRLKRQTAAQAPAQPPSPGPSLSPEQAAVVQAFASQAGPFLLFGATGSGKTEVYLHCVQELLAADPQAQALVMVPEINLTPQLEARFRSRFEPWYGGQALVSLHSGLTPAQRLRNWLAAHSGQARIVLGTRMAVFASMPGLRLIVVDEEHDPSYKQQEGARYSARDLALYRSQLENRQSARAHGATTPTCRILLGSATPSLESWHHSRPLVQGGRYVRLSMPSRIGAGAMPRVRLVDMRAQPARTVFSASLIEAMRERVARGEQCLVLLNRRGWAPVLHCADCGWKSECPHCSAFRVFHRHDRSLRCHHCGLSQRVPQACPTCGNQDILSLGRGTEQLEAQLAALMHDLRRPDGSPARVLRIDADITRAKGALEERLAQVHAGAADVIVGTQMIAKGHDFRGVTLVAAVQADQALFSSDFRAPERLFALLMQAGGRAGRDARQSGHSELWVQTGHPQHPLFAALRRHDYPAFADLQLQEREQAGMPPFCFQALVRAEARSQELAQGFLQAASAAANALPVAPGLVRYPAVPLAIPRVANVERAQMLLECPSRAPLQRFLADWQAVLHQTRADPAWRGVIRWAIDVDPQAI